MTILAITPIHTEFQALTQALLARGLPSRARLVGRISGLEYGGGALYVAEGGLGKAQFGIQAQHLLDHLDGVRLLVCAGTAGSLVKNLAVADVVVATQTVEHDFNRALIAKPLPSFEGHAHWLSQLREAADSFDGFDLHFGPIASGDEGIVEAQRASEVHAATGALAVAWEGAGGARAAQFSHVPYLELRAISDGANEAAFTDFFANIPLAMQSIAAILHRLLHTPEYTTP